MDHRKTGGGSNMVTKRTSPIEYTVCIRHGGTYKIVLTGNKAFPFELHLVSPDLPTDPDIDTFIECNW